MAAKKLPSEKAVAVGLMLRLNPRLHLALRHLSVDRRTSLNKLIAGVLEDWLKVQPECDRYTMQPVNDDGRKGRVKKL